MPVLVFSNLEHACSAGNVNDRLNHELGSVAWNMPGDMPVALGNLSAALNLEHTICSEMVRYWPGVWHGLCLDMIANKCEQ